MILKMSLEKSIKEFVNYFCKEYNVDVCHDRTVEFCPCRFKLRFVEFCNFNTFIVDLSTEKMSLKYKKFLKLICKKNRSELVGTDLVTKDIQIRMMTIIKHIESGRVRPGDVLYCTKIGTEVIFLEIPARKYFDIYHKFGVFSQNVKYKTLEGEEGSAPIACFNRISKANYSADYDVEGKNISSKENVSHLERIAKRSGFRTNRIETPKGFKLIFFGDTQKKVDRFVELCSHPDFSLF